MTFEKIRKLIANQLKIKEDKITLESRIQEDLNADSLDIVEMLMILEEEFNVTVDEDEAVKIKTIGDIVKIIDNTK